MPAEIDNAAPDKLPLRLLWCVATTVAVVGGARYWEAATGLSYWVWLAVGTVPVVAGALFHRRNKRPLVFLGSRAEPAGVRRPGLGGLLAPLALFVVPWLGGGSAAALAAGSGAHAVGVAVTATSVTFAAVVLGYRAAETALNRRDAVVTARQGSR